jgi:hypothetical protein
VPTRQRYTAALATTFLFFSLQAQGATISFNYKPQTLFGLSTTGASNFDQIYQAANGWGVTFLEPAVPDNPLNYSTSAGTGTLYYNFFNVLNRSYPTTSGWTVTGNTTAFAPNSLQINTYGAIGTPGRVGADITVTYVTTMPGPNNTTVSNGNPTANLHWIQVVSTNNALTPAGGNPGTLSNKVDVARTNTKSPYYDQGGAANSKYFVDTSRRSAVEFENNWIASLFLVSGSATRGTAASPNTITVYNNSGITWGWQNFFFPNVNEEQFVLDVEQDVFAGGQLGLFNVNLDPNPGSPSTPDTPVTVDLVPITDYGFYEQAFADSITPAPSSWILLLSGLVGFGLIAHRRQTRTPC